MICFAVTFRIISVPDENESGEKGSAELLLLREKVGEGQYGNRD